MPKLMLSKRCNYLFGLLLFLSGSLTAADLKIEGLLEAGYIKADYDKPWLNR